MDCEAYMQWRVKVMYNGRGWVVNIKDLTYQMLLSKLNLSFKLEPKAYYHLYYIDEDRDNITLSSQEDFSIYKMQHHIHKLYLQKTNDQFLHYIKYYQKEQIVKSKDINVGQIIEQKREEMMNKLQNTLADIGEKIRKQMKRKLKQCYGKRKSIGKESNSVHPNVKCIKCKTGDDIRGTRYQCIECNYNICEKCEQSNNHNHPLIKIINSSQAIAYKIVKFVNKTEKVSGQQIKKKKYPEIIQQFLEVTKESQEIAISFYKKYPNRSIEDLLQIYLFKSKK